MTAPEMQALTEQHIQWHDYKFSNMRVIMPHMLGSDRAAVSLALFLRMQQESGDNLPPMVK